MIEIFNTKNARTIAYCYDEQKAIEICRFHPSFDYLNCDKEKPKPQSTKQMEYNAFNVGQDDALNQRARNPIQKGITDNFNKALYFAGYDYEFFEMRSATSIY